MKDRCVHAGCPPWPRGFRGILSLLVIAATFGCGTVLYKPGSTSGDYHAANDRCRKEGHAEGADFDRCMEAQGWSAKQFGAPAGPSDAKPSDAKRSVPVGSPSPGSQSAPAAIDAKMNVPTASPSPTLQSAPAAHDVAPSPALSDAPVVQASMVVKNWFKLGGTADDLAAAKQRCAAKLGVADHPARDSEIVTGEMLDCLRNEGWHAF